VKMSQIEDKHLPEDFNWKQYVENYTDLQKAGIDSREKAVNHWLEYGRGEGRTYKSLEQLSSEKRVFHDSDTFYPEDKICCVVAILKNEEEFVQEWVAYHRLIGVDHFFLYDNNPELPLEDIFGGWGFVTVVPWPKTNEECGGSKQESAYNHALENHIRDYRWAAFIDGDEFIVLKKHESIKDFLKEFNPFCAVSLKWYIFGHNGYYDNPTGLVIESLVRRKKNLNIQFKTISKTTCIYHSNPHKQNLRPCCIWVDVGKNVLTLDNCLKNMERNPIAYINHYRYRSFKDYMSKAERGETVAGRPECKTRRRGRLKYFVEKMHELNQTEDRYLQNYADDVREFMDKHGVN